MTVRNTKILSLFKSRWIQFLLCKKQTAIAISSAILKEKNVNQHTHTRNFLSFLWLHLILLDLYRILVIQESSFDELKTLDKLPPFTYSWTIYKFSSSSATPIKSTTSTRKGWVLDKLCVSFQKTTQKEYLDDANS
jgi:hypothetical protein